MSKDKIKVLIAKPGLDGHSRGARMLTLALREEGMNATYTGLRRTPEEIIDRDLKEKPDVLGISVFKGSLPASLFAFKLAKEHNPRLTTVMGGGVFADQLAPGSPDWDLFLEKNPFIDKIIIGEGELLFLKLLRNELPGAQKIFTLGDINGEILNISSLEIPDFSGFDLNYYPALAAYTSRSCPFQCNFCSETVRWGKYRKKDAEQVVSEIDDKESAYRAALTKVRSLSLSDYDSFRHRLGEYLKRRGFGYGVINHTIERMWQEQENYKCQRR